VFYLTMNGTRIERIGRISTDENNKPYFTIQKHIPPQDGRNTKKMSA